LRQPYYLAFAVFGILYSVASFGTDGMISLFFSEVHLAGHYDVGAYGVGRGLGALMGAVSYVLVMKRLGIKNSQYVSLVLLSAGCLLPLLNLPHVTLGLLWGLSWGFQETAFVTLAMRFSFGRWAATFFAISMIFSNVGTAIGEAIAVPLAPAIGYSGVFMGFAILTAVCGIFVSRMTSRVS